MKKIKFILTASLFCMLNSCTQTNTGMKENYTSGINMDNMDTTVKRGDDFYMYACGGWMKNNPLPGDYSRFGTFDQLAENNRKQINDLLSEISSKQQEKGTIANKISVLYNAVMDSVKQNELGAKPLMGDLAKIDEAKTAEECADLLAYLHSIDADAFFTIYVGADDMNSEMNILHTYQSGLGLGDRDYYLGKDEHSNKILEEYKNHIKKMFVLLGFDDKIASSAVDAVIEIESRIAKVSYSKAQLREPFDNYHKISFEKLKTDYDGLNWEKYFAGLGIESIDSVNVSQPEPLKECMAMMKELPMEKQRLYLKWSLINRAATSLGDKIFNQNFDFYGRILSGTKEPTPLWKRAVNQVNGSLGEAVGQMYVEKYFPEANKKRMLDLVKNLQMALKDRMQSLTWMGDSTKALALDKLASFHVKIGYPDKWRDYSALDVSGDNLWELRKAVSKFNTDYICSKYGKPVDREEWHMTPQTVNAYYNPSTNEVCFPAGILQYPFFDMTADDAFNYGAIGVVIGHEMTHGFDDQGRLYDKKGNLNDWWTKSDGDNFKSRAKVLSDFFSNITVAPDTKANGEFTLGENLADHGGLQISFQAYKNATAGKELPVVNGLTADQRFFIAYAGVWAANITAEEILRRTKMDPHSLGRWRVNGALPHVQAWYDAFGVTEHDSMYVAPENRVLIW